MQSPRKPKDEKQVLAVEALIESWSNPFVGNQDLNSISTAKEAPADMSYDLLHACEIWEQEFQQFKEERLQSFMILWSWKTWRCLGHSGKKKAVSNQGRTVIIKANRSLFGRMILPDKVGRLKLRTCCNIALVLWFGNWRQRKTNKAALAS